ncbi:MAG: hypothetical protein V4638_06055 [Bacteroidota bacterium]
MKQFLLIAISILVLTSCGEANTDNPTIVDPTVDLDPDQFLPIEKRAKKFIQRSLGIPASENFTYKIYKKELNGDGKEDAIITVNRLEFALKTAEESPNPAKMAEVGFMGNYNYFFYFDGSSRQISNAHPVPSTPQRELAIDFEHITSENYFDFIVHLRIRNSSFSDFYTVEGSTAVSFFYWKRFDGLGTTDLEAYHFNYTEGSMSTRKNIVVTKAKVELPAGTTDFYTVDPMIKGTSDIVHTFFFHNTQKKYVTLK